MRQDFDCSARLRQSIVAFAATNLDDIFVLTLFFAQKNQTIVLDRKGAVRDVIDGLIYADDFDQKVRPLLVRVPQ